jgi:hypothetical protein
MDERTHKETYYVGIADGMIAKRKTDSPWDFKIEANDEEIIKLRELIDWGADQDWQSFTRAQMPALPYHFDRENDAFDLTLKNIYALIYQLGDEEAKQHIEKMGMSHLNDEDKATAYVNREHHDRDLDEY